MEKVYNNFPVFENDEVKVNSLVKKCVIEDPGLYFKRLRLCSSYRQEIPMISVNQNNKITRGYIVGRITALKPKEISEMHARQDSEEKIDDLGMNDTVKMKIETKE